MKQIDEAREFQATAAAGRSPGERGRRRPGERLGQLASAMANDLHGIVNAMTDDGRKLLAELPEGSNVRAQAEQSLQSANRAGQLVRHLLRLSEREARATTGSIRTAWCAPTNRCCASSPVRTSTCASSSRRACRPSSATPTRLAGLLSTLLVTVRGALPLGGSIRVSTHPPRKDGGRRRNDTSIALALMAEGYGMVSVPTTVCDEVVTRSGGTFGAQVDLKAGTTTFTAGRPAARWGDRPPHTLAQPAACAVLTLPAWGGGAGGGVDLPLVRRGGERLEEGPERGFLVVRHLEPDQHAAEVGAVVAVVEQADVPASAQRVEELRQRARALRELEAVEPLVRTSGARPPTMWRTCSLAISLSVRSSTR